MEELECSQGGGTEQRVLVRECVGLMRLLMGAWRFDDNDDGTSWAFFMISSSVAGARHLMAS